MKRALCLLICLVLLLCGGCGAPRPRGQGLTIVATIFPPYDFARQVAGDRARVKLLLAPGADAHSFEPTPGDIIDIQNCDLFIYSGGENEKWASEMIDNLKLDKGKVISMLDLVEPLRVEDAGSCGSRGEYDEHVWTSPLNAILIAGAIADKLCGIDPDNAEYYSKNNECYAFALSGLDAEFRSAVSGAKRRTLVFADRFPARYFAEEYGLTCYAAFPGCSAESEASAGTLAFIADKVKKEKIPVVLSIELSNGRLAEAVAENTGAKHLTFNTCHNLTRAEFDAGESYISLMERNLDVLKEALN